MTYREGDAPRVSVIVPVYNSQRYIARCLDSILGQTYQSVEVVAVDDGSTDSSPAILDEYAAKNPGRVVVEHRANGGVASARNMGIELATGEYLTFADNDDWLEPDCLEEFVGAALRSGADLVCGSFRRPDENGKIVAGISLDPQMEWAPYAIGAAWAKLYRTSFVRGSGLRFLDTNIGEDLHFTLPAVCLAGKVEVISYCGYNWFYNTESVSSTKHRHSQGLQFEHTLDAMLVTLRENGVLLEGLVAHYVIRLVVWFLFYTRRGDGPQVSDENSRRYAAWLDQNLPAWRSDGCATPARPKGDTALNRIAVWLFVKHPAAFSILFKAYR